MPWQQNMKDLLGKPVGVSLVNGQGTSGILCGVQEGRVYILEYLYQDQFALKHYPLRTIQDIHPFPPCQRQPRPPRPPRPLY